MSEAAELAEKLKSEGEKMAPIFGSLQDEQWSQEVYTEGTTWTIQNVLSHFVTSERGLVKLFEQIRQGDAGSPDDFSIDCYNEERLWDAIAFAWCMVLFAMMPLWHFKGGQNPSGDRSRVKPEEFVARTLRFVEEYKVGEENGIPIAAPPPGSEVYLLARMWSCYPVAAPPGGRQVHDPSLLDGRQPRLQPLPGQHQLPGRAGLRLRARHAAEPARRLPDRLQRVLRHQPPQHAGQDRSRAGGDGPALGAEANLAKGENDERR